MVKKNQAKNWSLSNPCHNLSHSGNWDGQNLHIAAYLKDREGGVL